jgi:4-amino-4-deoxy-L-arabinose transferase-like glycosyltransferase
LVLAWLAWRHGLSFACDPRMGQWDWFWQAIPVADLLARPWQSFWHLHAQPPLFSLWGLFWLRLAGPAHFPAFIQLGYVLLGAGAVALTARLALALMRRPAWAWVAALIMAVNPALFYYEAFLLYEPLVLFFLIASAWCLWRALASGRAGWLVAFVATLNLLVLTRSLYHLLFLLAALCFAWPCWRSLRPTRAIALFVAALLLPTAWYAKDRVQYGFFGASSWYGLGLYRCVERGYNYLELRDLTRRGILPDYMEKVPAFCDGPSHYAPYGFRATSPVPLLARVDFHNINVPTLSRRFADVSLRLILMNPWRYLCAVHDSYVKFSRPPSHFSQLAAQQRFFPAWDVLVTQGLYGQWLTYQVKITLGLEFGSLFYFYFPLLLLGGALWAARRWRENRTCARQDMPVAPEERARPLLAAYMLFACLYVAAIGCLLENGENERFRFALEPFTLILNLILLRSLASRAAARLRPDPASSHKSPAP